MLHESKPLIKSFQIRKMLRYKMIYKYASEKDCNLEINSSSAVFFIARYIVIQIVKERPHFSYKIK